MPGYLSRFWKD